MNSTVKKNNKNNKKKHRKINLWPYYDNPWATPGGGIVTVDTEYGKLGLGVCYDIHKILR